VSKILTSLSFHPNLNPIHNSLIANYLAQFDYSWHPVCCYICDGTRLIVATGDQLEIISSSSSGEVLLTLFRAAKSSISPIALLCSSALHRSFVWERTRPCYRRAVFIGDDLAIQSGPRSAAPDGQGAMVALVRPGRQPHTLGSIDKHEYSGYARRSKHFLFGPCLSA
jgi:hypothetical protein